MNKQNEHRLIDREQDDSQWEGGQGVEGLSKKEKGPMDNKQCGDCWGKWGIGELNGNGKMQTLKK